MNEPHSALSRSTHALEGRAKASPLSESVAGADHRILWIDGVGGFLLIDSSQVLVGQAVSGTAVDVAIVGDLSRQACAFRRNEGDYLLQPLQPMKLDGQPVDRAQLLGEESIIQLGSRIRLKFTRPNPLSATAKIELESLNRFKPSVDGVLMLADSCILGPNAGSHVVCPWEHELLMFQQDGLWHFRSLVDIDVNGKKQKGQIPIEAGLRLRGEDFSLSIE